MDYYKAKIYKSEVKDELMDSPQPASEQPHTQALDHAATGIGNNTGCHRRNGPNFGRVFLMLNYTDITQNTYIQS